MQSCIAHSSHVSRKLHAATTELPNCRLNILYTQGDCNLDMEKIDFERLCRKGFEVTFNQVSKWSADVGFIERMWSSYHRSSVSRALARSKHLYTLLIRVNESRRYQPPELAAVVKVYVSLLGFDNAGTGTRIWLRCKRFFGPKFASGCMVGFP